MTDLTGKTLGKYRVVERLGRGGMAEVYKAFHPRLDRYVAIKVLHGHLAEGEDFQARFEREAKAVAALHHPNIIQIHDFDIEQNTYYMVMEYVAGGTLKSRMDELGKKGEPMPLGEVRRIFGETADALAYAHEHGMLHRDVKPANVLLDAAGRAILSDFGIARLLGGTSYTVTGALIGTPAYMSPEQGRGETATVASDIYALGVILYELVTGKVPFDADTPLAIIHKHIFDPLPMPRRLRPEVPEALERVIMKAMAKAPEDRYDSVRGMKEAVERALGAGVPETLRGTLQPEVAGPTEVRVPILTQTQPATLVEERQAAGVGESTEAEQRLGMEAREEPSPPEAQVVAPTEVREEAATRVEATVDVEPSGTIGKTVVGPETSLATTVMPESEERLQPAKAPTAAAPRRIRPVVIALPVVALAVVAGVVVALGGIGGGGEPSEQICGTVDECVTQARDLQTEGDLEGWLAGLDRAIGFVQADQQADYARLWCERAEGMVEMGRPEEAKGNARTCLAWSGGNREWIASDFPSLASLLPEIEAPAAGVCETVEACMAVADELRAAGDLEGLIPVLDRAINLVPPERHKDFYWLWCDWGMANVRLNRPDEARRNVQACLEWSGGDRELVLKQYPALEPMLGMGPQPPEAGAFKIGVLGPFSGPNAGVGQEIQHAAIMAFEEIDFAIGPYKIELVFIDSQSDPEKATRAYEEAIVRDGIQAGLLGWHSSEAVALMDLTAKYKVPHFFSMGAMEVLNEKWRSDPQTFGYWVKGWPAPRIAESRTYADGFKDLVEQGAWTPASKKIAIAISGTEWNQAIGEFLAEYMKAAGWEIAGPDYFPVEQVDFHPFLAKYKAANVALTVVIGLERADGVSAFTKQAREAGLPGLLVMHGLGWAGEWYELTGPASDGILDQLPVFAKPEATEWAKRFQDRWGMKPSAAAGGLSYDWTKMFIRMLEATFKEHGQLTRETIYAFARERLWTGEFAYDDGIIMPMYRFTPETMPDPVVGREAFFFPIVQYKGGEGKIIWPIDWAQAKLAVP